MKMVIVSLKIPSTKSLKGVLLLPFQPSFSIFGNLRFPKLFKHDKYVLVAKDFPLIISGCLCPCINRTKGGLPQ